MTVSPDSDLTSKDSPGSPEVNYLSWRNEINKTTYIKKDFYISRVTFGHHESKEIVRTSGIDGSCCHYQPTSYLLHTVTAFSKNM